MKNILIALCFVLTSSIYAQNLNKYKYVLVPEKFEFLKKSDEYNLNGLTHFLFNKYGFNAFLGKENLPDEALNNNCMTLFAEVISESNMFTTKLAIQLKDCRGDVVYTTPLGTSKEKSYKVAYNLAVRNAAKHLAGLNYKYNGKGTVVKPEKKPRKPLILEKEITKITVNDSTKTKTITTTKEIKEVVKKVTEEIVEEEKFPTKFFAQKRLKQGWTDYNIVDAKGVLYFVFYNTGKQDMYLVEQTNRDKKMLCFKKDNLWHLVSRDETTMEIKAFEIEFE